MFSFKSIGSDSEENFKSLLRHKKTKLKIYDYDSVWLLVNDESMPDEIPDKTIVLKQTIIETKISNKELTYDPVKTEILEKVVLIAASWNEKRSLGNNTKEKMIKRTTTLSAKESKKIAAYIEKVFFIKYSTEVISLDEKIIITQKNFVEDISSILRCYNFNYLPDELIKKILTWLPQKNAKQCSSTSKKFFQTVKAYDTYEERTICIIGKDSDTRDKIFQCLNRDKNCIVRAENYIFNLADFRGQEGYTYLYNAQVFQADIVIFTPENVQELSSLISTVKMLEKNKAGRTISCFFADTDSLLSKKIEIPKTLSVAVLELGENPKSSKILEFCEKQLKEAEQQNKQEQQSFKKK